MRERVSTSDVMLIAVYRLTVLSPSVFADDAESASAHRFVRRSRLDANRIHPLTSTPFALNDSLFHVWGAADVIILLLRSAFQNRECRMIEPVSITVVPLHYLFFCHPTFKIFRYLCADPLRRNGHIQDTRERHFMVMFYTCIKHSHS